MRRDDSKRVNMRVVARLRVMCGGNVKAPARRKRRRRVPLFPAEIAARRKRAKAERDKVAKRGRRQAMGPREIAAGLAAAATPPPPRRRGRPRRVQTPPTQSPANVLQAVGLAPVTPTTTVLRLPYHLCNYHHQKINRWRWVFPKS